MKLKKMLKYLEPEMHVTLIQMDAYVNKRQEEEIFSGCVFNIPWTYVNYYLDEEELSYHDDKTFYIYVNEVHCLNK